LIGKAEAIVQPSILL